MWNELLGETSAWVQIQRRPSRRIAALRLETCRELNPYKVWGVSTWKNARPPLLCALQSALQSVTYTTSASLPSCHSQAAHLRLKYPHTFRTTSQNNHEQVAAAVKKQRCGVYRDGKQDVHPIRKALCFHVLCLFFFSPLLLCELAL